MAESKQQQAIVKYSMVQLTKSVSDRLRLKDRQRGVVVFISEPLEGFKRSARYATVATDWNGKEWSKAYNVLTPNLEIVK